MERSSRGSRSREESTASNQANTSSPKREKRDNDSIKYEMFCCGQSRKSTQSHLAQNNHLFEKATTAIIEFIFKVRITDSNVFNFSTLEDFPDPSFSNFITQSFTTAKKAS